MLCPDTNDLEHHATIKAVAKSCFGVVDLRTELLQGVPCTNLNPPTLLFYFDIFMGKVQNNYSKAPDVFRLEMV